MFRDSRSGSPLLVFGDVRGVGTNWSGQRVYGVEQGRQRSRLWGRRKKEEGLGGSVGLQVGGGEVLTGKEG